MSLRDEGLAAGLGLQVHLALGIELSEPIQIPPSLRLTTMELQLDDLYVQGMLSEVADVQRRELERLERACPARRGQPRCLACDGTELETLGPDAYRCSSCGHEGGEGLPKWLAARKRAEIAAMSPDQRIALALRRLEAARNLLAGINLQQEQLGIPNMDLATVVLERSVPEDEDRLLAIALHDLLESEQQLDQAAMALSDELRIPPMQRVSNVPLRGQARTRLIEIAQAQRAELERLEQLARS
jgi:hypothetical protein